MPVFDNYQKNIPSLSWWQSYSVAWWCHVIRFLCLLFLHKSCFHGDPSKKKEMEAFFESICVRSFVLWKCHVSLILRITFPALRTIILSESRMVFSLWAMVRMVQLVNACLMVCWIKLSVSVSMAAVASSRIRICKIRNINVIQYRTIRYIKWFKPNEAWLW